MSKYHYRVTKFSKPFNEDDDQLKEMFWQAVAENLKATDNLNIWLESSKTDVSTWKLLDGDTDYKLLVCSCTAAREDVELVEKIASRIGVLDWDINYVLECYKYSRPFVIVGAAEGEFDSIYFMERVDKDQLTDMEYALSNLPEKEVGTIEIGNKVTLNCWPNCYLGWPLMNEMIGSTAIVSSIGYSGKASIRVDDQDCLLHVTIINPVYLRQTVSWPVRHVTKEKPDVTSGTDDEKSWY